MKKEFEMIKQQILECEKSGNMFKLPPFENCQISTEETPTDSLVLYGIRYLIEKDGDKIEINYQSKDKCRSFQVNPDRSVIKVIWSRADGTNESISDAWDEKC